MRLRSDLLLFVLLITTGWLGSIRAETADAPPDDDLGFGSAQTPLSPEVPRVCSSSTDINYFTSFPCTDRAFAAVGNNNGSAAALRLLRRCDVFAYVASELAARHVNGHLQGIFTYSAADDYLLPDLNLNLISSRGTEVSICKHYTWLARSSSSPVFFQSFISLTCR